MLNHLFQKTGTLKKLTCLPPAGASAYAALRKERKEAMIRAGERYLNFSYPALPASLYMELSRNGNRTNYEKPYFERRAALSALTAAECVEQKGRFLPDIVNGIYCIAEESSWTIPAHNTYVRDTEQYPLPRSDRPILDLFACETGAVLASVHALLAKELQKLDPEITARIERELDRRIVEPYLQNFYWFMGNGIEPTNNWTVWCTQNVLYSVFLMEHPEETYRKVLKQAVRSCDCFIEEYGDDGCCPEGASYYHHAALCLYSCLDLMDQVSGGVFREAFREEKIRNIANYIMKVHVSGECFLNYADCDLRPGLCGVKEFAFAKATGQEDMMRFCAAQYRLKRERYGAAIEARDVFELLNEAFLEDEVLAYAGEAASTEKRTGFSKQAAFSSTGIYAVQGDRLYLSVKSGDTTGSHKHNDVGSFIVYADGQPLLIDPGVGSYTKETFSEKRYEIWTMQSDYHNLPSIAGFQECGMLQHIPGKYEARDLQIRTEQLPGGTERYIHEMELAGAYDERTPIRSYVRRFSFSSDGPVEISEDLRFTEGTAPDWTLHFMSEEKPEYLPETRTLQIGTRGRLIFDRPVGEVTIEWIDTSDVRLNRSWKKGIYRTSIRMRSEELNYQITV